MRCFLQSPSGPPILFILMRGHVWETEPFCVSLCVIIVWGGCQFKQQNKKARCENRRRVQNEKRGTERETQKAMRPTP